MSPRAASRALSLAAGARGALLSLFVEVLDFDRLAMIFLQNWLVSGAPSEDWNPFLRELARDCVGATPGLRSRS